jgi:hypothetical protein
MNAAELARRTSEYNARREQRKQSLEDLRERTKADLRLLRSNIAVILRDVDAMEDRHFGALHTLWEQVGRLQETFEETDVLFHAPAGEMS